MSGVFAMSARLPIPWGLVALVGLACQPAGPKPDDAARVNADSDTDADTDADTDSDADADADTDADTDTDADSDTDADTEIRPDHLGSLARLVPPDGGRWVLGWNICAVPGEGLTVATYNNNEEEPRNGLPYGHVLTYELDLSGDVEPESAVSTISGDGWSSLDLGEGACLFSNEGQLALSYGYATDPGWIVVFDSLPDSEASYTEADAVISSSADAGNFGHVTAAGDITGDGQSNLLIQATRSFEYNEDSLGDPLYVTSFSTSGDLSSNSLKTYMGPVGSKLKLGLASNGDFNADGIADFAAGGQDPDPEEVGHNVVWLVSGGPETGSLPIDEQHGSIRGFGTPNIYQSSLPGDLNNDGYDDIIVSTFETGEGGEHVYTFLGPASGALTIDDAVASIDGPVLAKSSAPIGDLDGDTVPELALQGPCEEPDTALRCVYLFHGQDVVGAIELEDAWTLQGAEPGDYFGETIAAIGDVNEDGFGDFAIAAPADAARGPYGGMVYLIPGRDW